MATWCINPLEANILYCTTFQYYPPIKTGDQTCSSLHRYMRIVRIAMVKVVEQPSFTL